MKNIAKMKCFVLIALVGTTAGCGVAGKSLSAQKPEVTQLGQSKFNISFFSRGTDEAAVKLKEYATNACGGRTYAVDSYDTQDYQPVYLHSKAVVSCR